MIKQSNQLVHYSRCNTPKRVTAILKSKIYSIVLVKKDENFVAKKKLKICRNSNKALAT